MKRAEFPFGQGYGLSQTNFCTAYLYW